MTEGRILCVDENQVERVSLGYALAHAGYDVEFAADLETASAALRRSREGFRAVVLGPCAPRWLRYRVARAARALRSDLQVLTMGGGSASRLDPHAGLIAQLGLPDGSGRRRRARA